jgi:hypothetical protein
VGAVNNFNNAVRNLLWALFLLSLSLYIAIIIIIIIISSSSSSSSSIISSSSSGGGGGGGGSNSSVISVVLIRTCGLEFHPKPSGDA